MNLVFKQGAIGVIVNSDYQVLIAKRPQDKIYAGYWEFPGGKIESKETPLEALTRELREELGIELEKATPFMEHSHQYPEYTVLLHIYLVEDYSGMPSGCEGQQLAWVSLDQLKDYDLLPGNYPIVSELLKKISGHEDHLRV